MYSGVSQSNTAFSSHVKVKKYILITADGYGGCVFKRCYGY